MTWMRQVDWLAADQVSTGGLTCEANWLKCTITIK